MTEIKEVTWLAGLLEGEGAFMFHAPSPVIALQMTDRDVVEDVAKIWGVPPLQGNVEVHGIWIKGSGLDAYALHVLAVAATRPNRGGDREMENL